VLAPGSRPGLDLLVYFTVLVRNNIHGRAALTAVEAYPGVEHSRVRV
jgi:hypothetical protein